MAAPPTIRYASEVVITSANNVIRADDSGAAFDATIPVDTYFLTGDTSAASDLVAAIVLAFENAGAGDDWAGRYNSDGSIGISDLDAAWSIDWDHANTTFDGTVLGIADTSAAFGDAGGTYVDTDYQTKHTWISTQAVASDTGVDANEPQEADVSQSRAKSGAVWTVKRGSSYDVRTIAHAFEVEARTWPTSGSTNVDFATFWDTANAGQRVRYYPDTTSTTVYFDGVFDEGTCSEFKPARLQPGVELWSWPVRLRGYVA